MSLVYEERGSDSPYLESVTRGWTVAADTVVRPAENHWHMVLLRLEGKPRLMVVGPLTSSGVASWGEGAELLWIKLRLGAFMPHLPPKGFVDVETVLPGAADNSFWLKGAAWEYPNFDNVETFINRLVREELLVRDPVVDAALQDQSPEMSPRTVRHHFLRATGLTQSHIRQMQRAQQAAALLQQGLPILDAVHETGYFDQPHLTRSLKRFLGATPAQLLPATSSE